MVAGANQEMVTSLHILVRDGQIKIFSKIMQTDSLPVPISWETSEVAGKKA
jgi:hypothetical protein